jgi:hypothetical protein
MSFKRLIKLVRAVTRLTYTREMFILNLYREMMTLLTQAS